MGERLRSRLFTKAVALEVVGKNMKSAISARGGNADARRGRGRPPKFDRDVALREAMKLFWEHGFEGTSTDDLEAALKMGPSSILNSFGSKEQLYALAIETYMGDPTKYFVDMLNSSPDTRQAFENLVNAAADEFTRSNHPTGCMISLAGTHMSAAYESIRALLAAQRALSEKLLADRLRRGVLAGGPSSRYQRRGACLLFWHDLSWNGGAGPRWALPRSAPGDRPSRDARVA